MKYQEEKLFDFIKKKIPNKVSVVEEISDVLNISYDAAYRRINGKTTLSFTEALELTNHYKIPIHSIYNLSTDKNIFVRKNTYNNTFEGLEGFFKGLASSITLFSKYTNADILYAAKDIPIYYTPNNTLYEKFKLNVFLNVLSDDTTLGTSLLRNFEPSQELINEFALFKDTFRKVKMTEIWSETTINSTLYQIFYFYEIKTIGKEEAIQICEDLKQLIQDIEKQASSEIWNKEKGLEYELYSNRLINLNNTMYLRSDELNTMLIPYTSMSHIQIEDEKTCKEIEEYFKKQLKYSKKVSGNAEVDRKMFFTAMYDKVDQLKKQIEIKNSMSFM